MKGLRPGPGPVQSRVLRFREVLAPGAGGVGGGIDPISHTRERIPTRATAVVAATTLATRVVIAAAVARAAAAAMPVRGAASAAAVETLGRSEGRRSQREQRRQRRILRHRVRQQRRQHGMEARKDLKNQKHRDQKSPPSSREHVQLSKKGNSITPISLAT